MKLKTAIIFLLFIWIPLVAEGAEWFQVKSKHAPVKFHTPSMEKKLWAFISQNTERKFPSKESYTYQYKSIGEGKIYINALCSRHEYSELQKELIMVFDGGSCYFQAVYDLNTHSFISLNVNGEA
jgi:hypothetical protein